MLCALAALTLASCKEDPPQAVEEAALGASPALMVDGAAVDALCFINRPLAEGESPSYPTKDCADDTYRANPAMPAPLPESFISTGYIYTDPQTPDEAFPGVIGYRFLGDYRGLKAVQVVENSGGTGVFTAVQLLRPEADGRLAVVKTLAGGDRCNGGISEAFMNGHTLVYSVNLTPFDFLSLTDYNPHNLQPYDDLDACAVCCYGHLQYVDERPHAIILEEDALQRIDETPEEEQTMQTCFDEIFVLSFRERKTALSLRELRDFVRSFHKTCTGQ